ncbi:plasmid partitioning protein [Yersinia aldovae]|uniref:ParA family protein n=1 Tax=Yersinia aldovae TaxID=29483 RepID=UPI0005E48FA9|nr:ParA family protein [Yersinia aldovae]CNK26285.1 plasmid partitioning protein [Yersinia aldovae]
MNLTTRGLILLFGSHKGGVGKSTLLISIAVALAKLTRKRIVILETDSGHSIKRWIEYRDEAEITPIIHYAENYTTIEKTAQKLAETCDYVLIDSPGHDSAEFRKALSVADILFSPIDPNSQIEIDRVADLAVTVKTAQAKLNPNLRAYVILNKCSTRPSDTEASSVYKMLNDDPDWLPVPKQRIYERTAHKRIFAVGKGIHEYNDNNGNKARGELELLLKETGIY